jgi:iron(III) transport system ATP-binding protein
MRIGNRIAVMRAGRVAQAGSAEELYHQPAGLFVARLFSEINEITYRVVGGHIATPMGALPAPGLAEGASATVCIRERGITLTPSGAGFAGRVLDVKFLGDVARLEVGLEGFEKPLKVRVREMEGWARGAEVRVEIDPARVLIFPAETPENQDSS